MLHALKEGVKVDVEDRDADSRMSLASMGATDGMCGKGQWMAVVIASAQT